MPWLELVITTAVLLALAVLFLIAVVLLAARAVGGEAESSSRR